MSNISVDYDVLNQRGSPAWYTDTFANIPTAGYKGRMFISTDTFAFYRDTGTGWDLIGGPGTGTITGSGVSGQVSYFNGTQTLAGSNNLFWDNTNSRLGIGTITPGQALDVHGTANTLVQLNNTTTGNSNIAFQNQDVAKWRIGNVYNAGANSFDIQNATTSTTILSINNSSNNITFGANISAGIYSISTYGLNMTANGSTNSGIFWTTTAGISIGSSAQTTIGPIGANGFGFWFGGTTKAFYFNGQNLTSQQSYILPDASGTLALTSNLSAYLPLAGGTLTGLTGISVAENNYLFDLVNATENNFKLRFYNNGSFGGPRIVFKQAFLYQTTENAAINFYRGVFDNDGYMALSTAGIDRINISTGGFVGIGNANTTYNLDVTGTGRYTGILTLGSTISNGTYSYTLPSATGTLALTSNLSSYLPLAGGTLTGALGGTSAIFSSNLAVFCTPYNTTQYSLEVNGGLLVKNTGRTASLTIIDADPNAGTNDGFIQLKAGGTFTAAFGTIQTYYGASNVSGSLQLQPLGGNVLIGTSTNATYKLDIAGNLRNTTSAYFATASGGVAIGATSTTYTLEVLANAATWATRIYNASTTGNGLIISVNNSTTGAAFGVYNGLSYIMYATNSGSVLINSTTDNGLGKLQITGNANASSFNTQTGTATIGVGGSSNVYTMTNNGMYSFYCAVSGGGIIYMFTGIVSASVTNGYYNLSTTYNGANVGVIVSGSSIQIQNGGFVTLTWQWSVTLISKY